MQEKISFWVSMSMLVCIGIAALVIALQSTGMPISGWGLVCSVEDEDVVACFRDWITSGAAVLTGVAIVFAVAQVREANRQSDAATRASLVHFKGSLVEEHVALLRAREGYELLYKYLDRLTGAAALTDADRPGVATALQGVEHALRDTQSFIVEGVSIGDLPLAREEFSEVSTSLTSVLKFVGRGIVAATPDPFYKLSLLGIRQRHRDIVEPLEAYEREMKKAIDLATRRIAALDADVFAER